MIQITDSMKNKTIRFLGEEFTISNQMPIFVDILDKHPEVEFVQIQLNYLDRTNPVVQSQKLYDILHERSNFSTYITGTGRSESRSSGNPHYVQLTFQYKLYKMK